MISVAVRSNVKRYFFSSSVCIYRNMEVGEPPLTEGDAYPAMPDNEYGWEKLYAERMAEIYGKHYPITVRIGRFQNCYGPYCAWQGGREKAPAAICRKVAMTPEGGTIPVWGDGSAVRAFTYVNDIIAGIQMLMRSNLDKPTNIGGNEYVTVDELVQMIIDISGKEIYVKHVDGPVGVQARNFDKSKIKSLGWHAKTKLRDGLKILYNWIESQVKMTI